MDFGIEIMLSSVDRRLDTLFLSPLAREVRQRNLTYLTPAKLRALERDLRHVRSAGVAGDFLEFGVALGGSAVVIASHVEPPSEFHGYDVFGMIPPPGPGDGARSHARFAEIREGRSKGIGDDRYYGYLDDLYERVCGTFDSFGMKVDEGRFQLHRGRLEETLDPRDTRPVAFAHIDCDWHAPVMHCLSAMRHRLQPGGRVVLDDYMDYGGCRRAIEAFLAAAPSFRLVRQKPSAALEKL